MSKPQKKLKVVRFPDNHGWVKDSKKGQRSISRAAGNEEDSDLDPEIILVSRDPMEINELYEVRVDKRTRRPKGCFPVGVVTSPLKRLTSPEVVSEWRDAITVFSNVISCQGKWMGSSVGETLWSVRTGQTVGVRLDTQRALHVYVGDKHQGVAIDRCPHPCYAMFFVRGRYKQVTLLPVRDKK